MTVRVPAADLDTILALQMSVAWAGESAGDPARLGWWTSDLVDPEGGGDLFSRLVPQTAAWASLVLVREVARRVDESLRRPIDAEDRLLSLFKLGFEVDEQLDDRIALHRAQRHVPAEVLGTSFIVGARDARAALTSVIDSCGKPSVEIMPFGRMVKITSTSPLHRACALTAALQPLGARYPLPYIEPAA